MDPLKIVRLGRMEYAAAYRAQCDHVEEVLTSRGAGSPEWGRILTVEHDPVITVSRRQGAAGHLLATPGALAARGVALAQTDRGGDITYHGPGQLVVYPVLDLNALNLGLHAYMRMLEEAVIRTCGALGVPAHRDATATGVWVTPVDDGADAKVAAMGVRVRKWVSMHGLALNVCPDLSHFAMIVPCGLAGRPVTSLDRECAARGIAPPSMDAAERELVRCLSALIVEAGVGAAAARNV